MISNNNTANMIITTIIKTATTTATEGTPATKTVIAHTNNRNDNYSYNNAINNSWKQQQLHHKK